MFQMQTTGRCTTRIQCDYETDRLTVQVTCVRDDSDQTVPAVHYVAVMATKRKLP